MKRIAIVLNEYDEAARAAAARARDWCARRGHVVLDAEGLAPSQQPDVVLALGGDGTILRAVHELGHTRAPVLGVKFGRLGFLSGAPADRLLEALQAALEGSAALESRAMLDVVAYDGKRCLGQWTALNEVLLGRGARPGIITTRLLVDGHEIYTQTGDGLIAATATGSTAYALSAGGPILSPGYGGMALVALASHTLVNRALVTAPDNKVRIELPDPSRAEATLLVDGQSVCDELTHIEVSISEQVVSLVKLDTRLFFDTLASEFFRKDA